jgi:hypothetical protein
VTVAQNFCLPCCLLHEQFFQETVRKVQALYQFDCLRANKSTMAWGVEARVPFLDKQFLNVAMAIDPAEKMINKAEGEGSVMLWCVWCLGFHMGASVVTRPSTLQRRRSTRQRMRKQRYLGLFGVWSFDVGASVFLNVAMAIDPAEKMINKAEDELPVALMILCTGRTKKHNSRKACDMPENPYHCVICTLTQWK